MRSIDRRRVLAFGILVLWAGVVALHVRREYFKPLAMVLMEGAATLAPNTYFYTVRMEGQAIGLATSRLDTLPDGFVFEDMLTLDVPALDTIHRAVARTSVSLDRALTVRAFAFDLDSEIGRFSVRGEVAADSTWTLDVGTGGDLERNTLPANADLVLPAALPLRVAASGRLEVGNEYRARVFDPSVLAGRTVEARVTARDTVFVPDSVVVDPAAGRWVAASYDTVPIWRVEETVGGVTVTSWLDGDGRLVSAESPLGFTLERTQFEIAREQWQLDQADPRYAAGYGSIIEATAIASNVDAGSADDAERVAVRLLDVELGGFDLVGGRQELRGDTLVIVREDVAALDPGYRLPYAGGGPPADELGTTPLLQAADPRIIEAAREIADGADDPLLVARRLTEWVYGALEKDVTLSVPSALQVLEHREGDCNEHTVLYVALARALGLPARTAVGLVHLRGRFYYHAWPEVWLGRWVAVDPTLGQFPANAAHLRFLVGGLARQVELLRLIGRLHLEVV